MAEVIRVDRDSEDRNAVERAVEVLARGGLVALPTETVYGLAARADDPDAVARIFAAKGRPAHNPLIVHVPDVASARSLAGAWPPAAATEPSTCLTSAAASPSARSTRTARAC